jgi:hypothetical protein
VEKGNCYSGLDNLFVSNQILSKITIAKNDWAFESSNHAAVQINFHFDERPKKGPGIVKVTTRIPEDPNIVQQIRTEIEDMMKRADESWNPSMKLELLKMTIRTVFYSKIYEVFKHINSEIVEIENEIFQLEELKLNTLVIDNNSEEVNKSKMMKIDIAINNLKVKLNEQRNKLSKSPAFILKAKWLEYGEKSNKLFLSLMKCGQNQKFVMAQKYSIARKRQLSDQ